jgi:L-alanine-DL-glutamate epimerase-like enolase superfamily enzyme
MRIATMARYFDVDVVPHGGGGNLGTYAQLHFVAASGAPYGEVYQDPPNYAHEDDMFIFEDAPTLKDGYLTMPEKPGLGLTIKRDLIQA